MRSKHVRTKDDMEIDEISNPFTYAEGDPFYDAKGHSPRMPPHRSIMSFADRQPSIEDLIALHYSEYEDEPEFVIKPKFRKYELMLIASLVFITVFGSYKLYDAVVSNAVDIVCQEGC